jgi:hypothetical protein
MDPPSIVSFAYEHFQSEFYVIGFSMQPHKCDVGHLSVSFDLNTPSQFTTPLEGIRILGVPLGITSFTSTFIKNVMLEDVRHVNLFPRMGDVQIAFEFSLIVLCNNHHISYSAHLLPSPS